MPLMSFQVSYNSTANSCSEESVYKDPIRKFQESIYGQLLSIREGINNALIIACDEASKAEQ